MPVGELEGVVLQSPGERCHGARLDSGALSEVPRCLSRGRGAEHAVAGALEAVADRRQRRRLPGPGHALDEIEMVPTHQQANRHLALGGGERDTKTLLKAGDSIERGLLLNLRPLIAGQCLGQGCDALLVGEDAACRPHLLPAPGHDRQGDRVGIREDCLDGIVEHRDGQAVKMRGGGDDQVASGEGLLLRQAPTRAKQLAGEHLEVGLREFIGRTRRLDRGDEVSRGMAGSGEFVLPPGQQVLDAEFRLAVPGGPGRDRPCRIRGIGSDGGGDLSRAGRVQLADLGRDPGYRPASEASGRTRIGDDPVSELDGFGGCCHPPDSRRRVQVVSQERRVGALPPCAGVSHQHGIRDQDMVVHLGIASPGRRVSGGRPDETTRGDAGLSTSPPTTLLGDEAVQVLEGGVALGIDDLVHVLGATDHTELGHRLGR